MDKVFVIVATYNGMEWYERCFSSLQSSTIPVTTVVVDNDSHDGTVDYIRKEFPDIYVIESSKNLGFGKANNIGIRYALDHSADYVFLLNQDAWVDPDTLEVLVAIHHKHPEFGLLSPMHLNVNRTGLVMKYFCRQHNNEQLITDLYLNQLTDIYETFYIHAAAWLLPKSTLQTIGGFDPIFHHYAEDDDYLNRVRFHGMKIGVCPRAQIIHDHHDQPSSQDSIRYHRNQTHLAQYMDLNHPFHWYSYFFYYLRKIILGIFNPKAYSKKDLFQDVVLLMKNARVINCHRKRNLEIGETWL